MAGIEYSIRAAEPQDEGFIVQSYVGAARMGTPSFQARLMPKGALSSQLFKTIHWLLEKCETRVATLASDTNTLLGFSVIERPRHLHYVYVSKSYWRLGIGRALLNGISFSECVFRLWPNTMAGSDTEWLRDKIEGLTYLPYWLEETHGAGRKQE